MEQNEGLCATPVLCLEFGKCISGRTKKCIWVVLSNLHNVWCMYILYPSTSLHNIWLLFTSFHGTLTQADKGCWIHLSSTRNIPSSIPSGDMEFVFVLFRVIKITWNHFYIDSILSKKPSLLIEFRGKTSFLTKIFTILLKLEEP